jgi:hypothetical protein
MKTVVLNKGSDTDFGYGSNYVLLITNIPDLTGYRAKVKMGSWEQEYTDLTQKYLIYNISKESVETMAPGFYPATIEVIDPHGKSIVKFTDTVFEIRDIRQENENVQ